MWFKSILFLVGFSSLTCQFAFSQQTPVKNDSTHLYRNIETYSKRGKFTRFMYQLVFKPTSAKSSRKKRYKKLIIKPYSAFEGKIIRNINIVTLDPLVFQSGIPLCQTKIL